MKNLIKKLLREGLNESITQSFVAFHGSPQKIDKFVDDFVGGENAKDQNGPGIYFTTSREEAFGYAEKGYVYSVEIANGKFLDSQERSEAYLRRYAKDLKKLIMMNPDWEMDAQNWSENPRVGLENMIKDFIQYNTNERDIFLQVAIDVYKGIDVQFVRNMVKLGYDGVFINAEETYSGNHIVLYNPNLIKVTNIEKVSG